MNELAFVFKGILVRTSVLLVAGPWSVFAAQEAGPSERCHTAAAVLVFGRATPGADGLPRLVMRGSPLQGRPFHLEVEGTPGMAGFLQYSMEMTPTFLPLFGATLYPVPAVGMIPFSLSPSGTSPPLQNAVPVPGGLCGTGFYAQGIVLDPAAQGGRAFTRAARFQFGTPTAGVPADAVMREPSSLAGAYNTALGTIADATGDQVPDILVAGTELPGLVGAYGKGAVTLFRGHGDGTFLPAERIVVQRTQAHDVEVHDFDHDGNPDLAVTTPGQGGSLSILLGQGGGAFAAPVAYGIGSAPTQLAQADLNGDGAVDLLAVNTASAGTSLPFGALTVIRGRGDGTFSLPRSYNAGKNPRALAIADLNGDDVPDAIVGTLGSLGAPVARVSVLLGTGNGTFGMRTEFPARLGASTLHQLGTGDLNGDSVPDVVVASGNAGGLNGAISVLFGTGDGSLSAPQVHQVEGLPTSLVIDDLNGDQEPDVFLANQSASVLFGRGDGTFRRGPTRRGFTQTEVIALGDFTSDLVPDLVSFDGFSSSLRIWSNRLLH